MVVYSQGNIVDSLLKEISKTDDEKIKVDCYNALFLEFEYSDSIKAKKYLEKARQKAQKVDYYEGLAENYLYNGYFEEDKGNYTSSLAFYKKAQFICQSNHLKKNTARIYNAIGNSYFQKGDYPLALKNYLQALKIQTSDKNELGAASAYGNIGMVYSNLNDFENSFKYLNIALELNKKLDFKTGIATVTQNLGNLLAKNQKYEKALEYFNEALSISQQLNDISALGNINSSIGMVNALQGNYDEAQKHYTVSLQFMEQYGNLNGIAVINCNLGEVYTDLKQYPKADLFLNKSISIAKTTGDKECLKNAYDAFTRLDSLTNDFKGAFEHYKIFVTYRDSLTNEQIQQEAKASLLEFEYEKKQAIAKAEHKKEIENERALAEESKQKQNAIILFVTIGLLILLVFVFIIFASLKKTRSQNTIIEAQKIVVEIKNKEITDSIVYAKRIQTAILPPQKYMKELLPESFILYLPKDIVAGDFYWLEELNGLVLLAVCDCTGHGVPGAMVSVVCNNGLNRSIREYELTDPGKILDKTREIVLQEFEKSEEDVKDGMDVSLCVFDLNHLSLRWAGANNPLWIIRNNQLLEYKPNKQPIGKYADPKPFSTHEIKFQKGDSIYLFTDGFQDQFGGEKARPDESVGRGKKFKAAKFKELLLSIQDKSMEQQRTIIDRTFETWKSDLEQNDDVCVIGIRI